MSFKTISLQTDPRGIATLTLNRPEKHNALNAEMIAELTNAADHITRDETIRAVILRAAGKSFCAGGDLGWMRDQISADRAGKIRESGALAAMLAALDALPKPLIAVAEGNVYGGGIGLLSVCDIAIAKPGLRYALTETKLGLIPATIGPFVARAMGPRFARQVFFTATPFGDDLALRSGLVSEITEDIEAALATQVTAILSTAPEAVARAKSLLTQLAQTPRDEEIALTMNALADAWESEVAQTRIKAFLEKK